MKKLLLFVVFFSLSLINLFAQNSADVAYKWAYNIGSSQYEYTNSVAVDDSGYVYITGYLSGTVDFDPGVGTAYLSPADIYSAFVAKYDKNKNYVWAFAVGGTAVTYGYGITLDAASNVYVTGMFQNTVDFDPGSGTNNLSSAGASDIFVAKYNKYGNHQWAIGMGGNNNDEGNSVAIDPSGNVLVTGLFRTTCDFNPGTGTANLSSSGSEDAFYAKYDNNGNYVWAYRIGSTSSDYGKAITSDATGNVFVTGGYQGTFDFDPSGAVQSRTAAGEDIYLAKYTSAGAFVWAYNFGGSSTDRGFDVKIDRGNNVLVTGYFKNTVDFDPGATTQNLVGVGVEDVFFAKYTNSGNYVWAKSIGGSTADWSYGIETDTSKNVYITGYFQGTADFDPNAGTANLTAASGKNVFFAKYDSTGTYKWAKNIRTQYSYDIAVDKKSNVYIAGYFGAGIVDFDPNVAVANINTVGMNDDGYVAKYYGNCNLSFVLSSTNISCPSGNNGTVTTSVTGNASPFTYSWSNSNTAASQTGLTAGTYTVTITDTMGCVVSGTVVLTQPTAITSTITPTQTSCTSNSGTANVVVSGGTSPYSYSWNTTPVQTTQMATGLAAGSYTVTITDTNGCTATKTTTITQPSTLNVTPSHTNIGCNGNCTGSATVSVTGGASPYTYHWSSGETTASTLANLCSGNDTIIVTDNLSCTRTVVVTISTPSSLSFTTTQVDVSCNGGNNGSITVNATGGTNPLQYSKDAGVNYQLSNSFTGLSQGTYSIITKDNNGCQTSTTSVTVAEPTALAISTTITNVNCFGANDGTATAVVTGGTGPYTYLWNSTPNQTSVTAIGLQSGGYLVNVTDSKGCTINDNALIDFNIPTVNLCLVTVDSLSLYNNIIWEKPVVSNIDSFKIYRVKTFTLDTLIATVPYATLSEFVDSTANPNITQYDYKISTVDSCGNEGPKSASHRTIHMLTNLGLNQVNLQWNFYIGHNVDYYVVWRDSTMLGAWQAIQTLSPASSSFSDNNLPGTAAWRYRVDVIWTTTCTPTARTNAAATNTTRSNTRDNYRVTAINNISASQVELFPNPATESININLNAMAAIKSINLKDATGRLVSVGANNLNSNHATLNTSDLAKGIYFIELNTTNGIVRKSFVKQ